MAFVDSGYDRGVWKERRSASLEYVSLSEACKVGDVLGQDSNGLWKRALATVGVAIQGKCVALDGGEIGDQVAVSENPVVVGYTGGTPGAFVYVAEGANAGQVTETAPTTAGDCNTVVGVVLEPTVVVFFLGARIESLAAGA